MVDRKDANLKLLQEADDIQNKTIEAANRALKNVIDSEELGIKTIEEQQRQGQQIDQVNSELESANSKLDKSQQLQNKFDAWAGNWLGFKKGRALRDASNEINQTVFKQFAHVKEIYEQEKYDSISRTWSPKGMVLCTDPTIPANELFDPTIQTADSSWSIDDSLPNLGIEGWTYAYNFNTLNKNNSLGANSPKWNSFVRRRKWRFTDKKTSTSDATEAIRERNYIKKAKGVPSTAATAEKIGYIPRGQQVSLVASGLASTNRTNKANDGQELDEDSQREFNKLQSKDKIIDEIVDKISSTVDNLGNLAKEMNQETRNHINKLDKTEELMQRANEKTTVVNSRLRHQLK